MSEKPDLLFIAHRIPYPPDKGDKIRSHYMLRHLCERYRVTLACLIDDPADEQHIVALNQRVHRLFYQVRTPGQMKPYALWALLTGRAFTPLCFHSRQLQRQIDAFLDQNKVKAVVCFCSSAAAYVFRSRHRAELQKTVLLADLVDVDSEKWREYADKHSGPLSWLYRRESRKLLPYEQRIIAEFDRTFLVSEEEKAVLARHGSVQKVEALSNGVNLEYFWPLGSGAETEDLAVPRLLFTGAMDYWPNIEAVLWFARDVFPQVRQVYPQAVFCIAGRHPALAVLELKRQPGIEVTGTVQDMRRHLASATLCVVPLRIARGIQNKVLEGMAMQKTVVATRGAATGLKARAGEDLVVVDEAEEMAQAIIDLLADAERRRRIGRNARAYVEREHSWEKHLKRLDALIDG
ncbi:TIGR03087 family PEP-CTERM/XrtA system glycosyltransferase [Desulfuromonas thiophila]|uniref:TIGR03087 family PEP-CTERM/XrtA system glycosyltransferase n=1 Tax=Desulfuromonas thiophila TaxID=57664 RepID=UPI0024A90019|nr:TIGR03087 family PEP-CTERM/XrtA system glycosyltransferase [Desulfuromonas thiophila]